jgi:hypothetical protein
MALAGSLEDVAVSDLLQFIHVGGRSGTLALDTTFEHAEIAFHHGRIVNASNGEGRRLGELLVAAGAVDEDTLAEALTAQLQEEPRLALGQILLAREAVTHERLCSVLTEHVKNTIGAVLSWREGTFRFDPDEVTLIDGLALSPAEVLPELAVDTQMVLLDALRLFDEKNRDADPASSSALRTAATCSTIPPPRLERLPRIHVVTPDPVLADEVIRACDGADVHASRVMLREAGTPRPREPAPVVVLDARPEGYALDTVSMLRRSRPRSTLLTIVNPADASRAYDLGSDAVLGTDASTIAACARSMARRGTAQSSEEAIERRGFARLRRVLGELRAGLVSATISLQIMSVVSERLERAVLFMVRPDALVVLGAFGETNSGSPLATATQRLSVARAHAGALTSCIAEGRAISADFDAAALPVALADVVGRPFTGQYVVLPILGTREVIAVIYADNGSRNGSIDEIDILELATAQVGVVFENEVLRRRLLQREQA